METAELYLYMVPQSSSGGTEDISFVFFTLLLLLIFDILAVLKSFTNVTILQNKCLQPKQNFCLMKWSSNLKAAILQI